MSRCFQSGDILLPDTGDMQKWSVIACDQHTSDISYWVDVREFVGASLSTLNLILPEAELAAVTKQTIENINTYMETYLKNNVFKVYPNSYVYLERTLLNGDIRQGIVGVVDLETYHYFYKDGVKVCATEETVMERIPPRVAVRENAPMEFGHIIVFCDDENNSLIEPVGNKKDALPLLYDFELMAGGGHIRGWLIDGENAKALDDAILKYEQNNYYLVADGNHSLVTAKSCYEKNKESGTYSGPARFALVELENINSPAIDFEPIHRILLNTDVESLLRDIEEICVDNGAPITWSSGGKHGTLYLNVREDEMEVAVLQRFLDQWLKFHSGEIDYLHGEDVLEGLAKKQGNIGFLLPKPDRKKMFACILSGKALPRKTFSLGHTSEKRYYLEGRKIK